MKTEQKAYAIEAFKAQRAAHDGTAYEGKQAVANLRKDAALWIKYRRSSRYLKGV